MDCENANGMIFYSSDSEEKCLSYLYCWTPESTVTGLLTLVNSSTGNCSNGGKLRSLFQWKHPKWIGGTFANTKWTLRQAVQTNMMRDAIDFPLLQSKVSLPAEHMLITFLQNRVKLF